MTQQSEPGPVWYLDTSVALRIVLAHSPSAVTWFDEQAEDGAQFVSSRLLELEMVRVMRRESLDTRTAYEFAAELTLLRVDDRLLSEAAAIRSHTKALDALHLASAQRVGPGLTTVVTHDTNMARVADSLGFDVFDPVAR